MRGAAAGYRLSCTCPRKHLKAGIGTLKRSRTPPDANECCAVHGRYRRDRTDTLGHRGAPQEACTASEELALNSAPKRLNPALARPRLTARMAQTGRPEQRRWWQSCIQVRRQRWKQQNPASATSATSSGAVRHLHWQRRLRFPQPEASDKHSRESQLSGWAHGTCGEERFTEKFGRAGIGNSHSGTSSHSTEEM